MKLSICMMVKNEEKNLNRCLQSLQSITDKISSELIIVDTGSSDSTVEIAKRYTENVYYHEWNNNFSQMRNISMGYASGEWIFIIDADEELCNSQYIVDFLNGKEEKKFNSIMILVKNIINEKNIHDSAQTYSLRFFRRNSGIKYEGVVHNAPVFKAPVVKIDGYLLHYGYISTDNELMEKKFKRTSTLLLEELNKNPDNIYYWYQLAVSYAMHDEHEKAVDPIEKAYDLLNKSDKDRRSMMYVYIELALVYLNNRQYEKCEKICKEAINVKNGYIDIYYCLAGSQAMLEKNEEAIINFTKYLEVLEDLNNGLIIDDSVINHTIGKEDEVYRNLMVLYDKNNDYDMVLEYGKKIKNGDIINDTMSYIIELFLKRADYCELKEYFKNSIENNKELENRFYVMLEHLIKKLKDNEKMDLLTEFSDRTQYGILCKIRKRMLNNNYSILIEVVEDIKHINFVDIDSFYGDIIYYLLKAKQNINEIIQMRENQFVRFIEYIADKYEDINEVIYNYLEVNKSRDIKDIRLNKTLARTLLILDNIAEEKYKQVFYQFIYDGTSYIKSIYSNELIEKEMVHDLKSDEEAFLLYLCRAYEVKNKDKNQYINELRKALEAYPYMKKGIEYLKEDFENELDNKNREFEQYKLQVKNTIKNLIANEKFDSANTIIEEYEEIVPNDVEIILYKSQITVNQLNNSKKYKM